MQTDPHDHGPGAAVGPGPAAEVPRAPAGATRRPPEAPDGSPLAIALATGALIAEAKQLLMDTHGLDAEDAFELLRRYSRASDLPIRDVALQLVRHEWLP